MAYFGPRNGLLSQEQQQGPQQQQQPQQPPSFWDRLSQLYSGAPSPMLSAAQNQQAEQQARLAAGLQMMMAAGERGPGQSSLLQIIAQGLAAGQAAGGGARQNLMQQQRQEEMQQLLAGGGNVDRQTMENLLARLIAQGDYEGARALSEYMKSSADESNVRTVTVGSDVLVLDPKTGELLHQYRGAARQGGGSPISYVDESGQRRMGFYNPDTNQIDPIAGAAPASSAGVPSEMERKAAAFASFLPEHVATVDRIASPSRLQAYMGDKGLRELVPADQQILRIAGAALAEAWLRLTTGAAYNEREFQTAYMMFIPQAGDTARALEYKQQNRQALMRLLQQVGQRAIDQGFEGEGVLGRDAMESGPAGQAGGRRPLNEFMREEGGQ